MFYLISIDYRRVQQFTHFYALTLFAKQIQPVVQWDGLLPDQDGLVPLSIAQFSL